MRSLQRCASLGVCVIAVATIAIATRSAGAQGARIVTLDDAISTALDNNVTLLQSRTAAKLSEVAVSEAQMRFVPDLSVTAAGTNTYGRVYNTVVGAYVDQPTKSLTAQASSGINLFTGFHDVATLQQAKSERNASRLDLGRAEETAVFTVISDFLTLISQQDQWQVQRENLAAEEKLEQQIRDFVTAGARASADLYQQQADVARARLAVVQAQRSLESSKLELLRTVQLDPLGSYDFQGPATEALYSAELGNVDDLVAQALARRSDLAAEEARVDALEQNVRVAASTYWPNVSLAAGYGSNYTSALSSGFHDQLDIYRNGTVSLNVSIPIFDRYATRNAVRRAELQAQNERIALDSKRYDVVLQVKTTYVDYQAARGELTAAEAGQQTARLAVEAAQERFKAGAAILVEVSEARSRYELAESALVTARYNLAFQSSLMKYYLGQNQGRTLPPPKG
jgi:outer membrane protein